MTKEEEMHILVLVVWAQMVAQGLRVGGARSGLRWRGVQLGWWGAGGVGGRTAD